MGKKISSEMKARNLANMGQCKVGLEVHFKDGVGCKSGKNRSKRDVINCGGCNGCGKVVVQGKDDPKT